MSDINRVILRGHLGADPDVRQTEGGATLVRLRIATTERWVDADGKASEATEWHSVTAWNKLGTLVASWRKGQLVLVEGRMRTRSYEQNGEKKWSTDVQVMSALPLSGPPRKKRDDGGQEEGDAF